MVDLPHNPISPPKVAGDALAGFDLRGRRIVIYGAESSAGQALVAAFRDCGATVAVTSATTDGTALFALKKVAAGGVSEAVDLTNATNVQVATKKLRKELGGLDVAVVVAAPYLAAPIAKTTDADFRRLLDGTLTATYNVFRCTSRDLAGDGSSRLIAVVSGVALRSLPQTSAMAAAQAGVLGLVRSLAHELGPKGITVNAIVTGWMADTIGRGPDDAAANPLQRYIPMRRFGAMEEIGPLAVYLASTTSGYVTGRAIAVDGGILKHL